MLGFAGAAWRGAGATGLAGAALWALAALAAWTFIEYWVHRALFHHAPILRAMHMTHHARPDLLEGSPPATLPLGLIVLTSPVFAMSGIFVYSSVMVGLLAGYVGYSFMHYAAHHVHSRRAGYIARARRRHMLHHFGPMDKNFGVTSGFWDHVFGTAFDTARERKAAASRV